MKETSRPIFWPIPLWVRAMCGWGYCVVPGDRMTPQWALPFRKRRKGASFPGTDEYAFNAQALHTSRDNKFGFTAGRQRKLPVTDKVKTRQRGRTDVKFLNEMLADKGN